MLHFWFGHPDDADWGSMREDWFTKSDGYDQRCRDVCLSLHERAADGEFGHWADQAGGALALIILLDQLPRNMFRGTPRMYASDPTARAMAELIDARGFKAGYTDVQKLFAYLPFEHAENLDDQIRHVAFVEQHCHGPQRDQCLVASHRHHEIIERFGRFPHRNDILGRDTTDEEHTFLKEPMSSF
ncbi:MAG: DUF924 domain-containing protein [Rhodospirillaceae bacterium]|nr:DUF924 domain-containing protein [Rhodospirillaceae bacterium]